MRNCVTAACATARPTGSPLQGANLHADMNLKRAALDRTRQPDTPAGDYRPDDPLITWLQSL